MTAHISSIQQKPKVRYELSELNDGTWELKVIQVYQYDNPMQAKNKLEELLYARREKKHEY